MSLLQGISKCNSIQMEEGLSKFIADYGSGTSYPDVKLAEKKQVWRELFEIIQTGASPQVQEKALVCCRILSRDRAGINECIENADVDLLLRASGITQPPDSRGVQLEAKKVLSNLIHQSSTVQAYCTKNGFLEEVIKKIKQHKDMDEMERFDLKLIFLLTALCPEQRSVTKDQHSGVTVLNKVLLDCASQPCSTELALYSAETMKVLFNLTLSTSSEDTGDLIDLCESIKRVLSLPFQGEDYENIVLSQVINLVTNLDGHTEATKVLFIGDEMKNVQRVLGFFMSKLEKSSENSFMSLKEEVSPALSVLWSLSKMHPEIRKYLKNVVLPPLTAEDIKHKPEEGTSARSRLVALLTNPDSEMATMTAEFLFVLCKHNVGKLVKYSGYGNAAGLLARRGLMTGGRGEGNFSSSEESDTEEYQQEAHKVNPITGCVEKERRNPLEGMSEEQKEYEAMRLVNMMDQLVRGGYIQPATMGEDGRPTPVEHVLQLQKDLPEDPNSEEESD